MVSTQTLPQHTNMMSRDPENDDCLLVITVTAKDDSHKRHHMHHFHPQLGGRKELADNPQKTFTQISEETQQDTKM